MTDINNVPDDPSAEFDAFFGDNIEDIKNAKDQPPMLQWEKTDEEPKKRYKSREYKMACFIMGCLIQEEVVSVEDCTDGGCSGMMTGIDIITACLEGNLAEGYCNLPFDF